MEADFERLFEAFSRQVHFLKQLRADGLNASTNLSRLCQSLLALATGLGSGVRAIEADDGGAGHTLSKALVKEQENILSTVCASADAQLRQNFIGPIENELLRARDAFFRTETRRRLRAEIDQLHMQAQSHPQVQQYLEEKVMEHEATTRGLVDTLGAAIERHKFLVPKLVPDLADFQIKFYAKALAQIREATKEVGEKQFEELPRASSLKSAAPQGASGDQTASESKPADGIRAAEVAAGTGAQSTVREQGKNSSEVPATRSEPPTEMSEEERGREELRRQKSDEIQKKTDAKLAEVRERENAEGKARDEVDIAKSEVEPRVNTWTQSEQLRGHLVPLLLGLEKVIPSEWNWNSVSAETLSNPSKVKLYYNKAILLVHPDKLRNRDAHGKALGSLIFEELQNAWKVFSAVQEGEQPPHERIGPKRPFFGNQGTTQDATMSNSGTANINSGNVPYGNMNYNMNQQMNPMGYNMPYGGMGYPMYDGNVPNVGQNYGFGVGYAAMYNMGNMYNPQMAHMMNQQGMQQQHGVGRQEHAQGQGYPKDQQGQWPSS